MSDYRHLFYFKNEFYTEVIIECIGCGGIGQYFTRGFRRQLPNSRYCSPGFKPAEFPGKTDSHNTYLTHNHPNPGPILANYQCADNSVGRYPCDRLFG